MPFVGSLRGHDAGGQGWVQEGEFDQLCRASPLRKPAESKGGHPVDFKRKPVTLHY